MIQSAIGSAGFDVKRTFPNAGVDVAVGRGAAYRIASGSCRSIARAK
jgi:hypothetical protein